MSSKNAVQHEKRADGVEKVSTADPKTCSSNTINSQRYYQNASCSGQKRKYEAIADDEKDKERNANIEIGQVVSNHYNEIVHCRAERNVSRIFFLRNFHNWIKSALIMEHIELIRSTKLYSNDPINVLDLCCGQGGDLHKWRKCGIRHLICADIAEKSLENCKKRYESLRKPICFTIEYVSADCTKTLIRTKFKDLTIKLDLVSCQFALHYGFESLQQAKCLLKNASDCLRTGGYFIGTIPNANELVARFRRYGPEFGNDVYHARADFKDLNNIPLFGAKYYFNLDTAVADCPEFLVHFPTLIEVAKLYGFEFVKKFNFADYFDQMKSVQGELLVDTDSLEPYPPASKNYLVGQDEEDYTHADKFLKDHPNIRTIGTLSKSEWEASSIYLLFVFKKVITEYDLSLKKSL